MVGCEKMDVGLTYPFLSILRGGRGRNVQGWSRPPSAPHTSWQLAVQERKQHIGCPNQCLKFSSVT